MSRTALTPQTEFNPYSGLPSAGELKLNFATANATDGNSFPSTGVERLIVHNTHATVAKTVTIFSVPDELGRPQDIEDYSVPALEIHEIPLPIRGFRQNDGSIYVDSESTDIKLCVLRTIQVS